ncbi:MAG: 50S ribosomal protein L11 methyltransferase, partial [Bryobacteraceae bacterium]
VQLIAAFESNEHRASLLARFAPHHPAWEHEDDIDWVQYTKDSWPGRTVGQALYLAPPWCEEPTPAGRIRLNHNPGLACGTGDHPCTQMALEALESLVTAQHTVLDIGTGSGILAIAARLLGARTAVGVDTDRAALIAARENFTLNALPAMMLVEGSVDCVKTGTADVTVANISSTVLLMILEDLLRATKPGGKLILTGFAEVESAIFRRAMHCEQVLSHGEWQCVVGRTPYS